MTIDQRILRDSISVTFISFVSRGLGFLAPIIIAAFFGASQEADSYYLANTIPTFLINVLVVALRSAVVPVLVEQWVRSREDTEQAIGTLILVVIGLSGFVILVMYLIVPWSLSTLIRGMASTGVDLTIRLTLLMLPMISLSTLVGLFSAVLNARKRFILPALAPGIRAIAVILVVLIGARSWGIYSVVIGMIIGETITATALYIGIRSVGIKLIFSIGLPPTVKQVIILTIPMILGMTINQLNPIIDRIMAAPLGEGSISALDYADRIILIPMSFLGSGFYVVILSHWSQIEAEGKILELQQSVQNAILTVAFICIPLSLYLILMRDQVVALLFQRGAFDQTATRTTAALLGLLALGLAPNMIGILFIRVQLVLQNTRIVMLLSLLTASLNILLNIILIRIAGLKGIALSTSLAYSIVAIAFWIYSNRTLGYLVEKKLMIALAKITLATILLIPILVLFSRLPAYPVSVTVGVSSVIAGGLFLALGYLLRIEMARGILKSAATRFRLFKATIRRRPR